MIYLDNAATSMKKPKEVEEGILSALNSLGNAGRGTGQSALEAARVEYRTRVMLSDLFTVREPSMSLLLSMLQRR